MSKRVSPIYSQLPEKQREAIRTSARIYYWKKKASSMFVDYDPFRTMKVELLGYEVQPQCFTEPDICRLCKRRIPEIALMMKNKICSGCRTSQYKLRGTST